MIHNISSEGLRLMKEYAAQYYGVNPEQIVVRHENILFECKQSNNGLAEFNSEYLHYLINFSYICGDMNFAYIAARINERYMSNKNVSIFVHDYNSDIVKYPVIPLEAGLYFNSLEIEDDMKVAAMSANVLRFNIV